MTVHEQKLEGEFRYVNSRLITYSEEIAFYQVCHLQLYIIYLILKKKEISESFPELNKLIALFFFFSCYFKFILFILEVYYYFTMYFYSKTHF